MQYTKYTPTDLGATCKIMMLGSDRLVILHIEFTSPDRTNIFT